MPPSSHKRYTGDGRTRSTLVGTTRMLKKLSKERHPEHWWRRAFAKRAPGVELPLRERECENEAPLGPIKIDPPTPTRKRKGLIYKTPKHPGSPREDGEREPETAPLLINSHQHNNHLIWLTESGNPSLPPSPAIITHPKTRGQARSDPQVHQPEIPAPQGPVDLGNLNLTELASLCVGVLQQLNRLSGTPVTPSFLETPLKAFTAGTPMEPRRPLVQRESPLWPRACGEERPLWRPYEPPRVEPAQADPPGANGDGEEEEDWYDCTDAAILNIEQAGACAPPPVANSAHVKAGTDPAPLGEIQPTAPVEQNEVRGILDTIVGVGAGCPRARDILPEGAYNASTAPLGPAAIADPAAPTAPPPPPPPGPNTATIAVGPEEPPRPDEPMTKPDKELRSGPGLVKVELGKTRAEWEALIGKYKRWIHMKTMGVKRDKSTVSMISSYQLRFLKEEELEPGDIPVWVAEALFEAGTARMKPSGAEVGLADILSDPETRSALGMVNAALGGEVFTVNREKVMKWGRDWAAELNISNWIPIITTNKKFTLPMVPLWFMVISWLWWGMFDPTCWYFAGSHWQPDWHQIPIPWWGAYYSDNPGPTIIYIGFNLRYTINHLIGWITYYSCFLWLRRLLGIVLYCCKDYTKEGYIRTLHGGWNVFRSGNV